VARLVPAYLPAETQAWLWRYAGKQRSRVSPSLMRTTALPGTTLRRRSGWSALLPCC